MPTLARPIARSPMRALFLLFALATFGLSGAGCTAETDGAAADVDTGDKADGDSDGVGCGEWWFPDIGCAEIQEGSSCLEGPDYFSDQATESYCRPRADHGGTCTDSDDCLPGFICRKYGQVGYGECHGRCGEYGQPCY